MKKLNSLAFLTALFIAISVLMFAVSCNTADDGIESGVSDLGGSELLTESEIELETEKKTEKKTAKKTEKATRRIKATEPPTMLEDTTGLDLNIKVLSQNVRCADDPNGNSVDERTTRLKALIDEYKPDLIGTQEVTYKWFQYLDSIEGYDIVGSSRAGHGSTAEEWSAVMYNSERFVLLDSDTFWLTKNPDLVGAVENSGCKRICTWAELYDRYTGEIIIMANTHLDHLSEDVRSLQAQYLLKNLRKRLVERYDECTIYLTGDFNCKNSATSYYSITAGGFVDSRIVAAEDLSEVKGTYHAYGEHNTEIDFCFYKGKQNVLSYEIISKKYLGEMDTEPGYVSDHYGVFVVFERKAA